MKSTANLKKAAAYGLGATFLLTLLAACGGGSGGGGETTPPALGFAGAAVKGPVNAAIVEVDSNDDGICGGPGDAAGVNTDADGAFSFSGVADGRPHSVCTAGGIDTITGADLTGTTMIAPPSASPVVTPLTTLVVGQVRTAGESGMQSEVTKIARALDVTPDQVLPATPAGALAVEAKANAIQTLLSGTARVVAAASGETSTDMYPAAIRGCGGAVANATTQGLTTTAALAIANAAIRQTLIRAQAAPSAPAAVTALSPVMVSEIAARALASGVAAVAAATPETLQAAVAKANAEMEILVSVISQISPLMTTAVANALGVTADNATAADALAAAVASVVANGLTATAEAELRAAVDAAVASAAAAGVAVTMPPFFHYHALVLSEPKINGTLVNTATTPYSVTVSGPLTSASLNVAVDGNPTLASISSAAFKVREVGGSRELWLFIDNVTVTNNSGAITVTAPASAKLYAYGKGASGTIYTAVLVNVAANVLASVNNVITVDWEAALNALAGQPGFSFMKTATGTFDIAVAMSGQPLYVTNAAGTAPLPPVAWIAPPEAKFPNGGAFSGRGLAVRVTTN